MMKYSGFLRIGSVLVIGAALMTAGAAAAGAASEADSSDAVVSEAASSEAVSSENAVSEAAAESSAESTESGTVDEVTKETVSLDKSWKYADESKINTGEAVLYHAKPSIAKGKTVCINAGHGTKGGSSVKTKCHPDGTPKVTGGTTSSGETEAVAVSTGIDMADGRPEAAATLSLALLTRDELLDAGYDVLMIRETDDVQLDNIARTVLANNLADCHIALHYDYTDTDKGTYFMSVPNVESYRKMEPVKSHWKEHMALGRAVVSALKDAGFKLFEGGELEMDLTQTSYSTVASIDLEVGDKVSDISEKNQAKVAKGIAAGVEKYFDGQV